ncbi:MAG: hypothetical protein SFY68_14165 [Candidatus Sumerlaeia bacterium]|nr:hypothetical protein [Candidatus Sumerlaeia bacterium]
MEKEERYLRVELALYDYSDECFKLLESMPKPFEIKLKGEQFSKRKNDLYEWNYIEYQFISKSEYLPAVFDEFCEFLRENMDSLLEFKKVDKSYIRVSIYMILNGCMMSYFIYSDLLGMLVKLNCDILIDAYS